MIKKLFSIIFSTIIVFSVLTVSAFSAEPAQTYEIFILAPDGLIIDKSESAPESGEVVTLTASSVPNDYAVSSVTATDAFSQEVTVTKQSDNVYYFTMPASNVTVTAALAPTYPVTYYINGGTSQLYRSDHTGFDSPYVAGNYTEGATFPVGAMPDPLDQNGKRFKEWNTQADGLGTGYYSVWNENFDDTTEITMPNGPLNLYAIWVDSCNVTVNINLDGRLYPDFGKTVNISVWRYGDPAYATDEFTGNSGIITGIPAVTASVFSYTSGSYGFYENYEVLDTVDVSGDMTVTINYYTVSFNSRGGSDVGSQIVLSGKKATAPTNPTKTDDTFRGWSTNETTFTPYDFSSTDVTATKTLYAFWNSDIDNTDNTDNTPEPDYSAPSTAMQQPIIPIITNPRGDSSPEWIEVIATLNPSGSVNSVITSAAVKKAAEIAKANGETRVTVTIPEGATGLSASTIQKLVKAADGLEIVLALTSIIDGEEVGSISLPINSKTGQILTGLHFETESIKSAQNYIEKKWKTDILGSFETAQKGGWGAVATLTIDLENLGFTADDGTKLYALIYDTKTGKWYQVSAEIIDGNVVIETKRTGVVTVVTDSVR
jgi:uncharacterized repeat protein (TIGR02543 family)